MTDARLHSTRPIDDELLFAESAESRDAAPKQGDAIVTPAAAEREATRHDEDVEKSQLDDSPVVPGETGAP